MTVRARIHSYKCTSSHQYHFHLNIDSIVLLFIYFGYAQYPAWSALENLEKAEKCHDKLKPICACTVSLKILRIAA